MFWMSLKIVGYANILVESRPEDGTLPRSGTFDSEGPIGSKNTLKS